MKAAHERTCSGSGSSQSGAPASSPVLTTSARPFSRSASGSVVSSDGSHTTRAGQWNAPTDVLRAGKVDRGLAADPGVDLADEGRRHGRPGDAAHVRRRGEPGDVGGRAAAERDDRAVAADREAAPEALEHGGGLRRLAGRHLVERDVACAERDLGPDAVDPGHVRVGDELDRPVARNEVAELVDRAGLDVDAGGGEEDPVDVARAGVGDVLVERLPVAVQRVKRRPRPARVDDPSRSTRSQAVSGVDVEQDRERARGEERSASAPRARRRRRARSPAARPPASTSRAISSSTARKPASPRVTNSSATVEPARASISPVEVDERSVPGAARRCARASSSPSP